MMKLIFHINLLLTNRQVANLCKSLVNNSSVNIKLLKTESSKIIQSGGFLVSLVGPLLRTGLPLMKNIIQTLAKSVLIPLGLASATWVADAGVKKILGPGTTRLIISNEEIEDIRK